MAGFIAELATQVQQRFGNNEQAQEIFEYAREISLASWRNGIEAGKRKSTSRTRPVAVIKGSALGNGRLTSKA